MTFKEILTEVLDWLQHDTRITYRALKRQFDLDDEYLDDLKDALLFAYPVVDEDGRGLVWTGTPATPEDDTRRQADTKGRLYALLPRVMWVLQRERRITYRELKHVFSLDTMLLAEICEELRLRRLALDEEGTVLVWVGETPSSMQPGEGAPSQHNMDAAVTLSSASPSLQLQVPTTETPQHEQAASPENAPVAPLSHDQITASQSVRSTPEAERRQLTVMFCDLADSTKLSQQLDPEDLREVVRAYQTTAADVIQQYEGHMAQYLGDGLLVYFGWPVAHEDDAQRAAHAGLGIVEAITTTLNPRLEAENGVQLTVRLGVHTGPVVVGEMGGGGRHENLATGETVNVAARLEGLAVPNTVMISNVTARLVQDVFELEDLGPYALKGVAESMQVFRLLRPTEMHHDEEESLLGGGLGLVGRDEEVGLLRRRWEQSKEGLGQAVLISGEAGIGKSSLVATIRRHVVDAGYTRMTFRSSPYHTNSALYPVIEHVKHFLQFQPGDTSATKLDKLERALSAYSRPLEEVVPLYAALLAVSVPEGRYPVLNATSQRQRQQTQDALVGWILEEAERQPTLVMWEDLHWADPSTLELLGLVLEQTPTVPMLHVLTFRPMFEPPWPARSHMTPITLNRLERPQVEALIARLAKGTALPQDVVEHIVVKTDGVPLYVEELSKMLLESDLIRAEGDRYILTGPLSTMAIPDTLQDSLMARLDQLHQAKEVAQLGAVIGREFPYELLQSIATLDDTTLQNGLRKLVAAELLYQRGRPPQSRYIFKHALIQDAAYQSLLRNTRQHYHQRIATVLEDQLPDTAETQPELLAYHFTEARLNEPAVRFWHEAGRRTSERSAYAEAINHFAKGLEILALLPETSERDHQELTLQMGLGRSLMLSKGYGAHELEPVYLRAQKLCEYMGDTRRLIGASTALWCFYLWAGQLPKARKMAEQDLRQVTPHTDSRHLVSIHNAMAQTCNAAGELTQAHTHFEEAIALYDRHDHRLRVTGVQDYGVTCRSWDAWVLWRLGYPDRARQRSQEALALAHELEHPYTLAAAIAWSAMLYCDLRLVDSVREQAESALKLATDHKFAFWLAQGLIYRGWALGMQGQGAEGIEQMQQGKAVVGATWAESERARYPVLLAEIYRQAGQILKGLDLLAEALAQIDRNEYRFDESERYRLNGELLLQQSGDQGDNAASCFHQALDVARCHQAKSLELRAAMSLARLWQSQDKRQDAYDLLAPVYGWFTEGFDTADLVEAQALLQALA